MKKGFKGFLTFTLSIIMIFTFIVGAYASGSIKDNNSVNAEGIKILEEIEEEAETEEVKESPKEQEVVEKEETKEEEKKEEKKEEAKPSENIDKKEDEKPSKEKEKPEEKPEKEKPKEDKGEEKPEVEEKEEDEEEEDELAEDFPSIPHPFIPIPRMMSTMSNGNLEDTIEVNKWADRHLGLCRVFDVNLKITGTPQQAPVDVVMIIDKSGSMNERAGGTRQNPLSRLYYAKQAAVNFAAKVLGSGGIPGSRVSLVTFSGPQYANGSLLNPTRHYGNQNQAQTVRGLTSNLSQITSSINGITAVGGTNTEAGFLQGRSVIEDSDNPNSNKVVIMFTDGLPTASNGNPYAESTDVNHIHNQRALAAGKAIYQDGVADVFTIGLLQGMNSAERNLALHILQETQNKGWYEAPTAADLDQIFDEISTQLGYAASNAKVVDKIGDNFDLIEDSLPAGATYNPNTRQISWKPGTIVEEASLTYQVRAKPNFAGGPANTNEFAKLTYTDVFGNDNQEKDFPVPEVDVPSLLKVSLTDASITLGESISLGTGTDPAGENYMSEITGGDGDGNYTYEWRVKGSSTVISTNKHPEVNPEEDTEYELTVIDSNGCKAVAIMVVRVSEDIGEISITKEIKSFDEVIDLDFFGIEDNAIFGDQEFEIKVTGPNGYEEIVRLKHGETEVLEELALGNYIITEINIDGKFQWVSTDFPDFELTKEKSSQDVLVTNKVNYYEYGIKKIDKETGQPLKNAKFKLKSGDKEDVVETGDNGEVLFKKLLPGNYTLEEVKAPLGYKLDDREISITIDSDGNITTDPELDMDEEDERLLVIENNKAPSLPETGSVGTILFTLAGLMMMAASFIVYRMGKNNKEI